MIAKLFIYVKLKFINYHKEMTIIFIKFNSHSPKIDNSSLKQTFPRPGD